MKAAAMTLRTVLLSLQALLAAAEPDDPQDAVVANQDKYKQNPEMFKQTARLWAHVYAGAPVSSPEYTKKIENLCAMGFDRIMTGTTRCQGDNANSLETGNIYKRKGILNKAKEVPPTEKPKMVKIYLWDKIILLEAMPHSPVEPRVTKPSGAQIIDPEAYLQPFDHFVGGDLVGDFLYSRGVSDLSVRTHNATEGSGRFRLREVHPGG
ncbi:hypothetical protein U0070_020321 [Myodes glareolus]|uniref:UBC core domain-containing protein n=1 Tax=Myodes glareolus TaxID=447135 RepID=A0AAW0HK09_MYOGA